MQDKTMTSGRRLLMVAQHNTSRITRCALITIVLLLPIFLYLRTRATLPDFEFKPANLVEENVLEYNPPSEFSSNYQQWVHSLVVHEFMGYRQKWNTSNLGKSLAENKDIRIPLEYRKENSTYFVLMWNFGMYLNRHIYNYKNTRIDPLATCRVKNCIFQYKDELLNDADAVVVHLQKGLIPNVTNRSPRQRWIFLTDESPRHTFIVKKDWTSFAGIFNWSMTYRSDSDIPVPYGRVVPLDFSRPEAYYTDEGLMRLVPNWNKKRKDVPVTVLISNCGGSRMNYIQDLMKYIPVHMYGACSKEFKESCPGHFRADCEPIDHYYFYLAFENSKCLQYMSEKAFHHGYAKGAIPVILGADRSTCEELLPPFSYLHVDDYGSPKELAEFIISIAKDTNKLLSYHQWRHHFRVLNEHGYFQTPSVHYCRICEALNFNNPAPKIYEKKDLAQFLDPKRLCH